MDTSEIREHMAVVGSDGEHIGTVDHIEGDQIKLTRSDPTAGGQHHSIPLSWIGAIDGDAVRLSLSSQDAMSGWQTERAVGEDSYAENRRRAGEGEVY